MVPAILGCVLYSPFGFRVRFLESPGPFNSLFETLPAVKGCVLGLNFHYLSSNTRQLVSHPPHYAGGDVTCWPGGCAHPALSHTPNCSMHSADPFHTASSVPSRFRIGDGFVLIASYARMAVSNA